MNTPTTDAAPRDVDDACDEEAPRDAGERNATGDEAIEAEIADDAEPVEPRHSIDQLPDGFWHAPRGPMTRLFAWLILLLIVGCVAAMIVAVVMGAME